MSSSSQQQDSEIRAKASPKLPWWVELLFVQIGLPDRWLPAILRRKTNSKKFLSENRKTIIFILLLASGLAYINPYTKYFISQNVCIDSKFRELAKKESNSILAKAKAVKYCNSGRAE